MVILLSQISKPRNLILSGLFKEIFKMALYKSHKDDSLMSKKIIAICVNRLVIRESM